MLGKTGFSFFIFLFGTDFVKKTASKEKEKPFVKATNCTYTLIKKITKKVWKLA